MMMMVVMTLLEKEQGRKQELGEGKVAIVTAVTATVTPFARVKARMSHATNRRFAAFSNAAAAVAAGVAAAAVVLAAAALADTPDGDDVAVA